MSAKLGRRDRTGGHVVSVTDLTEEERLREEVAALEAIEAVLAGAGALQQKLTQALDLTRDRLRRLRAKMFPGGESGESLSTQESGFASLVGESPAMLEVYQAIRRVSHSQATVLLRGESGTGKELVAKAIHVEGPRAGGPFIRLHCAALTETLLESELFGHERGAFTGAVETRKGRFEQADGGTLFLDEIGDIPPTTQVKLLRVLQERCFERVGGNRSISVDVRLIAATHRDLEAMVRSGAFREDLYYRLNVVPITLPPLRERAEDVPLLINHFLARFNRENRRQVSLGDDLLALMSSYHWPGNVRELQNCVERLVVMAERDRMTIDTVPPSLRGYFADMRHVAREECSGGTLAGKERLPLGESLQEIERQRLLEALERTGWVQARAARALGLTPRQVAYKMKKYGIRGP
ncbi:MAG TPA: sigma 54-interacting transcriptional regulator [Nitrospiraceae bacterium]|nr:sigma 54-interacting transcriptional regulator [Nitrospiraceae bacterium]